MAIPNIEWFMAAKKRRKVAAATRVRQAASSAGASPVKKLGKKAGQPQSAASRVVAKRTASSKKKGGRASGAGGSGRGAPPGRREAAGVADRSASRAAATKPAPSKTASSKAPLHQPGVSEGDRAPSFELMDQRGGSVSSERLVGHAYVLYFYPKDDTPGCTIEACEFRDAAAGFEQAKVRVIGVSPDGTSSHQKFSAKYSLPFTLLSDTEQRLATAYGSWALKKNYGREYMGVVRSTFLVGADGVIRKAWRGVRVKGHVAEVQAAAENMS
jgi:peroxiredoxin Q/BCP